MVLSLFRDLLSMASKLFSGKTSHDRMPAPRGSPKISKGDRVLRLHLDCGDADHLAESCSMSCSLSGPCPPCGHCWVDCPTLPLPTHLVSFPMFLLQRKISPTFGVCQPKADAIPGSRWRINAVLYDSWRPTTSIPSEATETTIGS